MMGVDSRHVLDLFSAFWRSLLVVATLSMASARTQADPTQHETWVATCLETKGFHDGDTLTCVAERGTFVVRLAGLDAPETGQAYWRVARDQLRRLAVTGTRTACYTRDDYGREVCRLYAPDGSNIVGSLINSGLAWYSKRYVGEQTETERARYSSQEAQARAEKRGLWAEPDPMPPWECRQLRKQRQKCR